MRRAHLMLAIAALAAGCTKRAEPDSGPGPRPTQPGPAAPGPDERAPDEPVPSIARMRRTVDFLAAEDMRGRRVGTAENRRAAEWLAARFEDIGLAPAVEGSYFHEFRGGPVVGRNVAGLVAPPSGASPAAEYVVVGAHFDGVGDLENAHRPAADDNASGVAALLEIARAVVQNRQQLRRHVVFAAFDAEEAGLIGSTQFVLDEVIPSEDTVFMVVFDLIGGKFFPWNEKTVIAMGTEHSQRIRSTLEQLKVGRPTAIELLGTYVLEPAGPVLARSDYRAYRKIDVPFVFFSSGTPWYYHMPEDSRDKIDFEQCSEIAALAFDLVLSVARDATAVDFIDQPKPEVHDLVQLHRVLGEILDHRTEIRLPAARFEQMSKLRTALSRSIARDKASRLLAHRSLMLIFEAAKQSRPAAK